MGEANGRRYIRVQVEVEGAAVLLDRLAWKPQEVLVPAARVAFCPGIARAVTVWPVTVTVAFQEPVMV
jgi:hypothetical protein